MRVLLPSLYSSYGTGKPPIPFAAARSGVGRHKRPDRDNAGRRVAITVDEPNTVREPGVVDYEAGDSIAGQQHEVLVAIQLDFGDNGAAGVELALDQPQVWTEPSGEGHPSTGVGRHGTPDQLVVVRVAAVGRQPGIKTSRIDIDPVVTQHHGYRRNR